MRWAGKHWDALQDTTTREMDVEGAVRAGKTTVCLWREFNAAVTYPGIHILLVRWTDAMCDGLIKPLFRSICTQAGVQLEWHGEDGAYDQMPNGSRVYYRGLKTQDQTQR
jgi:hypothetical protein